MNSHCPKFIRVTQVSREAIYAPSVEDVGCMLEVHCWPFDVHGNKGVKTTLTSQNAVRV